MKVDFTGKEAAKTFEPMRGWHNVEVIEGEERVTKEGKNAGGKYISWTLRVLDGPNGNRRTWHITSFSDGGLPTFMAFLQAVGFDTDGEVEFEIDDIVGKQLQALFAPDGDRTQVKGVKALGDSAGGGSLLP